ncbi:MAG: hypothetical protein E6R03_06515 [Hyphomicrobiaceae bacterium]|nr:MAG: hypothetical protein E6R03_06515 [Hyphomicrobiaceae bacterium]
MKDNKPSDPRFRINFIDIGSFDPVSLWQRPFLWLDNWLVRKLRHEYLRPGWMVAVLRINRLRFDIRLVPIMAPEYLDLVGFERKGRQWYSLYRYRPRLKAQDLREMIERCMLDDLSAPEDHEFIKIV